MDIALLPATGLLSRIRDGELTAAELLDAQLERVEAYDGDLQIVGPRLEDRTPLRSAERELGGYVEPWALVGRGA